MIKKLDTITFDDLMAEINPFDGCGYIFDLSEVTWVSAAALVQLTAACYALNKQGYRPQIILNDMSLGSYLARVNFISTVKQIADIYPDYLADNSDNHLVGSNPLLIEITELKTGGELPDLLNHIVLILRRKLQYKKYDAFDVATCISEICQNAFDHNSETCGFMAMQVYGKGRKRFLEIGVADYGTGLTETLRRNPNNPTIKSDLDAIRLAIKQGTSEYDDPTRGTGLHHLLEITYKHEGSVQIRSGNGKVRYRMDKRAGWGFSVAYLPGVQIALTLGTKKGLTNK